MTNHLLSVLTLYALALASSCACSTQQLKKDVSPEEARADDAACENQAQLIQSADYAYRGSFMEGANIKTKQNEAKKNCLISKGYR